MKPAEYVTLPKAIAIVVCGIVGGGIFLIPATMAQTLPNPSLLLLVWIVAGLLSLCGALSYGELASLFPKDGGEFIYLDQAFGERTAFLYGWTQVTIAQTASMAALASQFCIFFSELTGWGNKVLFTLQLGSIAYHFYLQFIFAILLVVLVCLLNCLKISRSSALQSLLVSFVITSILIILADSFFNLKHTSTYPDFVTPLTVNSNLNIGLFIGPLIIALWIYDGWNNLSMVSGAVKNASYTVPRALGLGLGLVIALYCLANLSFFRCLTVQEITQSRSDNFPNAMTVGGKALRILMGPKGVTAMTILIMTATFTCLITVTSSSSRIPSVMAQRGLFFSRVGKLNRNGVPAGAIFFQGLIAIIYIISSTYDRLISLAVFALWTFYAITVASLFIFRKRGLAASCPTPGYPIVPIIFITSAVGILIYSLVTNPTCLVATLIIGISGIIFFWFKKQNILTKLYVRLADFRNKRS